MAKKQPHRKPSAARTDSRPQLVCRNRRARHDYDILDQLECGISLQGSEVKSIRNGKISIDEAFARLEGGELYLHDCDIAEYPQATLQNHEPKRRRKLLLHKRELKKFAAQAAQKGLTLIPLSVYFSGGRVKVNIAVARGRKRYDKRQKIRAREEERQIRDAKLSRR